MKNLFFLLLPVFYFPQIIVKGNLGNNPIEMVLNIDSKSADGVYKYSKYNEPIPINGTYENEKLTLFESEGKVKTGVFLFNKFSIEDKELIGVWRNLKNNIEYKVHLERNDSQNEILQASSSKKFYFKTGAENEKNYVLIFDKKTNLLFQKIPIDDCNIGNYNDVSVNDYNFDGIEDFSACMQSYAGPNTSQTYFLFNPKTNKFFVSNFSGTSLEFDNKNKLITETNQCCAGASIIKNIYKVKNNEMILVEEHCYKWDEKSKEHIEKPTKDCN